MEVHKKEAEQEQNERQAALAATAAAETALEAMPEWTSGGNENPNPDQWALGAGNSVDGGADGDDHDDEDDTDDDDDDDDDDHNADHDDFFFRANCPMSLFESISHPGVLPNWCS